MAWSPGGGCLTSPASLAIGCKLSSRSGRGIGGAAWSLAPSLRAFCSCHCGRAAGLLPYSQLAAPGKGRGAAEGSGWQGGQARVGRTDSAACAGTPGQSSGPRPGPAPAPPRCSAVQQFAAASGERQGSAARCASVYLALVSGRVSGPSGWVWECQREGRFPELCRREPSPFHFQPTLERSSILSSGGHGGMGRKGRLQRSALAERCFGCFFLWEEVPGKKAGKRMDCDPARQRLLWTEAE